MPYFICRPNQSPPPSSVGLSHFGYFFLFYSPRTRDQTLRHNPFNTRVYWYYSREPVSSILTLCCPFLPVKTRIKALTHVFSLLFHLLSELGASSCSHMCVGCQLLYDTIPDLFFNGNCLMSISLTIFNRKAYIFKYGKSFVNRGLGSNLWQYLPSLKPWRSYWTSQSLVTYNCKMRIIKFAL
jgi:hypothetical protein